MWFLASKSEHKDSLSEAKIIGTMLPYSSAYSSAAL